MTRCDLCQTDAPAVLYVDGVGRACLDCCSMAVRRHVESLEMAKHLSALKDRRRDEMRRRGAQTATD